MTRFVSAVLAGLLVSVAFVALYPGAAYGMG